jgi:hypothetical protein
MNGPSTADEGALLLEVQHEVFLGAFAKLRNETVISVNSARVSVLMEQFGSNWTDFCEI